MQRQHPDIESRPNRMNLNAEFFSVSDDRVPDEQAPRTGQGRADRSGADRFFEENPMNDFFQSWYTCNPGRPAADFFEGNPMSEFFQSCNDPERPATESQIFTYKDANGNKQSVGN